MIDLKSRGTLLGVDMDKDRGWQYYMNIRGSCITINAEKGLTLRFDPSKAGLDLIYCFSHRVTQPWRLKGQELQF